MQIAVTFRHMPASEPLKNHAIEKIDHIKRYFSETSDAHVVLSVERYLQKAEININAYGMVMRSEESSGDLYNSIDRAVEKIESQVKRYRNKLITHRPREGARQKVKLKFLETPESLNGEISELPPTIVETKELDARPMMLDEAVMQMDLLHNDILVFLNSKTDQINVLYRKKDNKYGLIETTANV